MEGYIQLHRQIVDSAVFANPNYLKIWLWILIKANHKDREMPIKIGGGNSTVTIKRGEFLFGRNSSSDELCMSGSMIYRAMQKFEKWGMIAIKSNNQYSIVSVCNYDTYQTNKTEERTTGEPDLNQTRTRLEPDLNTNNNVNNVNNVNKNTLVVATDSDESITTDAMEVAEFLYESIKKWDDTHRYNRTKPSLISWAKDIDKAIRIDKRNSNSLKAMIEYLFTQETETARFWAPNIQSGKKLREKYDAISARASNEARKGRKEFIKEKTINLYD